MLPIAKFDNIKECQPHNSNDIIVTLALLPEVAKDTIPTKHISMFDDGEPLTDLKSKVNDTLPVGAEPVTDPTSDSPLQVLCLPKPLLPLQEHSQHAHIPAHPPNAKYYDAICCQENHELPLVHELPPPLPPSPYSKPLPEQLLWDVDIGGMDTHGEHEVALTLDVNSDEALLLAGCAFVEH
ncbi:hypothetical protein C0989_000502 [Termitomyces sp. Mn162]|nr:hypothetical protein C0989_000502 [Termitomyces sp. Mn162]